MHASERASTPPGLPAEISPSRGNGTRLGAGWTGKRVARIDIRTYNLVDGPWQAGIEPTGMIARVNMVQILPRRRETSAHLTLKELAVVWAREQGFGIAKKEVSIPHRKFRLDAAACAPVRKAPSRTASSTLTEVLRAAVIFECKQARPDLRRDNLHRETLREKVRQLTERKVALESLLQLHLPHLANGEALFPEYDSYRLCENRHRGYQRLTNELRRTKAAIMGATKFDRLLQYRVANLHYLVVEDNLMAVEETPLGWGLLIRKENMLLLAQKPTWQDIGVVEQLIFLQRLALAR
jgi:hypothetical protein